MASVSRAWKEKRIIEKYNSYTICITIRTTGQLLHVQDLFETATSYSLMTKLFWKCSKRNIELQEL